DQVWFVGAHADVGGGYLETGLSDIALGWMMKRARAKGVAFDDGTFARYAGLDPKHALDEAHDSWTVLWGFPKRRAIAARSVIAESVETRREHYPGYAPPNLPRDGLVVVPV